MKQLTMTKVLTPLAALAFAFGAQAAAVSTETFDTYTAGTTVISNQTGWSFTYGTDGADDASAVTAYDNNTPSVLPYGVSTAGANYLKLSTEDGTLFRSMDGDNGAAIQLNTGVFVDTDVQFTVTDASDSPTNTVSQDDKLVIWLEANGNATNLCVLGHSFGASTSDRTDKVYTLVPAAGGTLSITPGDWYRLTVKAISSFSLDGENVTYPAFQVYLDGASLKAYEYIGDATTLGIRQITDYQPYIPARTATMTELSKVGFSGEGALDSVVVTRETVVGTASELTFTWSSEAITSVSLPTVGATITSSGDTFRVVQSSTPLQIVLNGSNLANYNVTIDGVAYDPESTNTIVPNQSKTIDIVATAKDTVNVTFALNRDNWTAGDPALWTYISSIMVGDEDITTDLVNGDSVPISLKVGTNVTVAVNLTSPVAAATLSPAGATELTVSGFNIAVDAFGDGAAEITICATTPGAIMGDVAYATFADALNAAKLAHSGSIMLGADPAAGAFAIGASDNITIDLAGHNITGADGSAVFTVAAGGTLTITNSTGTGYVIASAEEGSACISNSGTLNLQDGKFSGTISGGTINVTGGFYTDNIANATILDPDMKLAETVQLDTYVWTLVAKEYYTAISLNKATTSLVTNETETLEATLTPASAADDSVTWTSSNDAVATVDQNGVVTAVGAGEATITAATKNCSATCTVTVTAPTPTPAQPTIDPDSGDTVENVEAATEEAATAKVKVAQPAASQTAAGTVSDETYQGYFKKTATETSTGSGVWTVKAELDPETVVEPATTSAAAIVSGTAASGTVTVPQGLYYKITTMTGLDGTGSSSKSGWSNGTGISVDKPGSSQGFIKVQIGADVIK